MLLSGVVSLHCCSCWKCNWFVDQQDLGAVVFAVVGGVFGVVGVASSVSFFAGGGVVGGVACGGVFSGIACVGVGCVAGVGAASYGSVIVAALAAAAGAVAAVVDGAVLGAVAAVAAVVAAFAAAETPTQLLTVCSI